MAKRTQVILAILLTLITFHLYITHVAPIQSDLTLPNLFSSGACSHDHGQDHENSPNPTEQGSTISRPRPPQDADSRDRAVGPPVAAPSASTTKIGKITMLYGGSSPVFERALQSHVAHGDQHGYPVRVLRQKMLGRLWTKPAWILAVVLEELAKPAEERLEWLFWFDADTYLINPHLPLEIYLPPSDLPDVHFLCGKDHNGLNDGAFLLRVNDYAVHLLASALSVESFRPEVSLRYSEQSAIEHVVHEGGSYRPWDHVTYHDGYAEIPQRWMNAYMGPRTENGSVLEGKKIRGNSVKDGDLLLHFVGSGDTKRDRMQVFMDAYDQDVRRWQKPVSDMPELTQEIAQFWARYASEHNPADARREKE